MPDTAANEALAHRWHMDLFQAGKLDVADEILAPGFAFHVPGTEGEGVEAAKEFAAYLRGAVPDVAFEHVDTVSAGDKVAIRWTAQATHQGELLGVPATGRRLVWRGIDIIHLRDGQIAEVWIETDNLTLLQQMGVTAVPEA